MVKRANVLDAVEAEAELPYEQTALARRALRARPRLALLLLVGAAGFMLEATVTRSGAWALGGVLLAGTAWGARGGRLGAIVVAALAAALALLLPLRLLFLDPDVGTIVVLGFVAAWGAILFPDVVVLLRDAELQHAYGRWARREP